jgi:hypothetical protein
VKEGLFTHQNLFFEQVRTMPAGSTLVQIFVSATSRRKHFVADGKILAFVANRRRIASIQPQSRLFWRLHTDKSGTSTEIFGFARADRTCGRFG